MPELTTIDLIYETALSPELWPTTLEEICRQSRTAAGGLIVIDAEPRPRALMTARYRPTYESFRDSGATYVNIRVQRAMARNHAGFLRDIDLCTLEELADDPIYRDYLRPFGLGWTVGTLIPSPTAETFVFDFAREIEQGPAEPTAVGLLDEFRPHLARAALLSTRLGTERARSMTEALATIGLPAAIIGAKGRTIAANPAFLELSPRLAIGARDRLVFPLDPLHAPENDGPSIFEGLDLDRSRSFPLPATATGPALVVHAVPIRRSAHDLFTGAGAIVLVTPVTCPPAPGADLLAALFDLTPAEARIARALVSGLTAEASAHAFGISIETVRSQIKAAMAKTGTGRQVDLVRLLLGLRPDLTGG